MSYALKDRFDMCLLDIVLMLGPHHRNFLGVYIACYQISTIHPRDAKIKRRRGEKRD
jgi:hypothetical protein